VAADILESPRNISDKIRALAAAGYSRSEIAKLVDRSYQQVRQVLVEDERLGRREASRRSSSPSLEGRTGSPEAGIGAGFEEAADTFGGIWRLQLENDGAVRLPKQVQAAMGVQPGGVLICELQGDGLKILTPEAALERARSYLVGLPSSDERDLVQELIDERRAEAAREQAGD